MKVEADRSHSVVAVQGRDQLTESLVMPYYRIALVVLEELMA